MVERQQAKWPTSKFIPSMATVADITAVLLDPKNGFTTNKPLITSPPSSQARPREVCAQSAAFVPLLPRNWKAQEDQDSETEVRIVRVYLEDGCFSSPQKTVAILSLPIFDNNCARGSFHVLSKDVVSALQESNSALEIPPDSEEDGWKIPFVRMYHGQFIDEMKFDPAVLEIPEALHIKLFVENARWNPLSLPVSLAVPAFTLKAEDTAAVILPHTPSTSTEVMSDSGTAAVENTAVQFLRGKLAERDGYKLFAAHRGRTVSNTDIVQDWQFAVDFKRDHNKIKIPMKIVLRDIQTALGIQSTWLTNAQTAIDIIGTYGKIREVAETLKREEDPPEGSIARLSFLTEWKKNHPA
ncbi:hypothetical protein B0H14DRAFT_2638528 [Mycena olivaceomarginata]|nr:hypothetical protein B0H14DRAFT_2638528 [Mycena olivaceomarginata]